MSGRKPESGAKLSPQTGMRAPLKIQSAPTPAKRRASQSSPFPAMNRIKLLAQQVPVQLLLVGQEGVEFLARDRGRLRDVVRVVLLHRLGGVYLGHHALPVRRRRVGRVLRDGDAAPHLEVRRLDALLLEGRYVLQAGEALVAHHAERAHLAAL